MNIIYEGDLRSATFGSAGNKVLVTDGSKTHGGKEEYLSPLDAVAAVLVSCMMTVMGIAAKRHDLDLGGMSAVVEKEMMEKPEYRIRKISAVFAMPKGMDATARRILENTAHACPVHKCLNPEIQVQLVFNYDD